MADCFITRQGGNGKSQPLVLFEGTDEEQHAAAGEN